MSISICKGGGEGIVLALSCRHLLSRHYRVFQECEQLFVSLAKHSGTYGSLCPASVRVSVCPVVTLSW